METNVNQIFEITGYNPDFNKSVLRVMAHNMDTQKEAPYDISFKEIAMAFCPDGEGKFVNVILHYCGVDPDSGPYTEPYDMPLSPAAFISEILENVRDSKFKREDRQPYVEAFDNVLAGILERRWTCTS